MTLRENGVCQDRSYLDWPEERAGEARSSFHWKQPGSNICLDFHGDPARAGLVVFSDGNHHMALRECLDLFSKENESLSGVFYATTPPGPIVNLLRTGSLRMGNLVVSASPHVFISPPNVLDRLIAEGFMSDHFPFVRNQGNVLLIKKGNPKNISDVSDLLRDDVRLFMSNPDTEKASYNAYHGTLKALTPGHEGGGDVLEEKVSTGRVLFGKRIHHREAPQAVADGAADAAMLFYHLALRFVRIFPDFFDVVPLGGSLEKPEPLPGNVIGKTVMGLVKDGGEWGGKLISFLSSKQAGNIYEYHGLVPISD